MTAAIDRSSLHCRTFRSNPIYQTPVDIRYEKKKSPPLSSYHSTQLEPSSFGHPTASYEGIPQLAPPQVGVFALFYLITKVCLISDNLSQSGLQQQMRAIDDESSATHKERIKEMQECDKKAKSTKRWDVMVRVYSWIGSFMSIFTGVSLIVTGANPIGGALLIAAGVISLTNHLLEVTGTWKTLIHKLAGDEPEKARAIALWMQISIAVVSMVLIGAGVVFGGLTSVKDAFTSVGGFFNPIASAGVGVLFIGKGISDKHYHEQLAQMHKIDTRITEIKYKREDIFALIKEYVKNLEKFWSEFHEALEMQHHETMTIDATNRR